MSTLRIVGKAVARTKEMSIAICIKRFSALVVSIIAVSVIAMVLGVVGPARALCSPQATANGNCVTGPADGIPWDWCTGFADNSMQCDDYTQYYSGDGSVFSCSYMWDSNFQQYTPCSSFRWYP